jgi:hypothetical protein
LYGPRRPVEAGRTRRDRDDGTGAEGATVVQQQVGERSGRLGRWGAAATAVGALARIACVLVVIATGQVNSTTPPAILVALSLLSALCGSLGASRSHWA